MDYLGINKDNIQKVYDVPYEDLCETMGKTGRQFVLDNFKWDVIVKRFLDFFES